MTKTIEEQARELAERIRQEDIRGRYENGVLVADCYVDVIEQKIAKALRTAKADGMDEAANLAEQEASASTYAPHASGILHIEYLIRATAQKVRDGE